MTLYELLYIASVVQPSMVDMVEGYSYAILSLFLQLLVFVQVFCCVDVRAHVL